MLIIVCIQGYGGFLCFTFSTIEPFVCCVSLWVDLCWKSDVNGFATPLFTFFYGFTPFFTLFWFPASVFALSILCRISFCVVFQVILNSRVLQVVFYVLLLFSFLHYVLRVFTAVPPFTLPPNVFVFLCPRMCFVARVKLVSRARQFFMVLLPLCS